MEKQRIFLTGYMGSGKTTVGQVLADKLGYDHIDMEQKIEEDKGMPMQKIFIKFGEHEFRNQEASMLDELVGKSGIVVSCGAGIVLDPMNCDILKEQYTVFLDGDEDLFFDRIKDQENLPNAFLIEPDQVKRREKFSKLYQARLPFYEDCMAVRIDVDEKTPEQIADEIAR